MSINNDRISSILYFIYNFHLLFLILAGALMFIFFFLSTKNLEHVHSRFQLYIFLIITNAYNLTIEQKITSSDQ